MSAEEFLADAEGGALAVDCHDHVLRIAFIYLDEGLWDGNGVFDVVEKLHARGWSFGEGELRFNRTLDIFYLAQLAAAIYRSSAQLTGDFPSPSDFPTFYAAHAALLHPAAWRAYYSPAFLAHPTTARFYRLPNLQDLPDSSSPLAQPRQSLPAAAGAHATKPPRWAHSVARTRRRQPSLPLETLTRLALRTLEATTARLRAAHPSAQPYSETQARFWLEHMKLGSPGPSGSGSTKEAWGPNGFGVLVAEGGVDVCAWEARYSARLWEASAAAGGEVAEPDLDLDGVWESSVEWCGEPDGGVGVQAWWRGWEGEVGSEEEVEFLAAVAVEETAGVGVGELDFAVRSHVVLGVMRAAIVGGEEREVLLEEMDRGMVGKGRIGEGRAGRWLREVRGVVEPYVRMWEGVWPGAEEERGEVLRRILHDLHTLPYVQVPNAAWHPVPQYAFVAPQNPYSEQQSPNADPSHVAPLGSLAWLQSPSVDTCGPLGEHVPKSV
ncbi:hypothetical protein VC83_01437 [Pseudogymnoascus destructans]|uniref:Uncharacterized protein n=1 Tax=Pseudogymnoascus destructans TaxID=655981 RepID=A0A177AJB9_9PEZI|nr:uncharacterized protein VC83_01437 [Pseudogymnoascus destructans]OAF62146.1 hypothetical protein VC83_01437 [Pseudogymnoascus destructans]